MPLDNGTKQMLIQTALNAEKRAYCPYSHYPVGAALLAVDGTVIPGCNVENASFPMTNCAEKTAICTAISQGKSEFSAICVVTRDCGLPCGSCRQVLNEFCGSDFELICCNAAGEVELEALLSDVLPHAFGPRNME